MNYLDHTLATPSFYHRDFERDVPPEEKMGWIAGAQRIGILVIPFLSLYQPFGFGISVTMDSSRIATHIWGGLSSAFRGDFSGSIQEIIQTGFAVMALAGTLFSFTIGLLITNGVDSSLSLLGAINALAAGEYQKSFENLLQTLSGCFYLSIMLTGSLELTLISALLQAVLCLYQARKEERTPEAIAKVMMGCVRLNTVRSTFISIQLRNDLLANKTMAEMWMRAQTARGGSHLIWDPLNDLEGQIARKRVTLSNVNNEEYDFGSHFHGYGKAVVDGDNLCFRKKEGMTQLDFKINHLFRERLQGLIDDMQKIDQERLRQIVELSYAHFKNISIEKAPFEISERIRTFEAYKITFEGLGSIYIGSSSDYHIVYDRMFVQLDEGKNIYDLHEMLSFVGLDDVLQLSIAQDIERLKMGQLFRIFYPREATVFERSPEFFTLPIEDLRKEIVKKAPEMEEIFSTFLAKMEVREILPGRIRYSIPGLAQMARERGARALTAGLTGDMFADERCELQRFEQVASIIKMGMISAETRVSVEMKEMGLAFGDFDTGGADSVYTQMFTQLDIGRDLNEFAYYSDVQFVFSLDLLETGTYQYYDCYRGERRIYPDSPYLSRPSILEFAAKNSVYGAHEVMIKDRISPDMIKGLIVKDMETRDRMLTYLREHNLVINETILGIPVYRFIRVGQTISEDLISTY